MHDRLAYWLRRQNLPLLTSNSRLTAEILISYDHHLKPAQEMQVVKTNMIREDVDRAVSESPVGKRQRQACFTA